MTPQRRGPGHIPTHYEERYACVRLEICFRVNGELFQLNGEVLKLQLIQKGALQEYILNIKEYHSSITKKILPTFVMEEKKLPHPVFMRKETDLEVSEKSQW